jgi:hypothetical protein
VRRRTFLALKRAGERVASAKMPKRKVVVARLRF